MKRIYLDYAATTPVDNEVLKEMLPYFSKKFGNAASLHSFGIEAGMGIEKARNILAKYFNAEPIEIVFTSGATESNNLSLKGVVKQHQLKNKEKVHIITTAFEHHCVLDASKSLERDGLAEVTFILPDKDGIIDVKDIEKAIKPNTLLISVMYVNNEIGTVQPIKEIGKMIKELNKTREKKIIFHTDATQAINYFDCDVNELNVDLLSMSAHKIYGPKGVGALYIRKGTPIIRVQDGGDQENRRRAGTHNVPGIVGLGKAIEVLMKNKKKDIVRIQKLRDVLIKKVLKDVPASRLNGSLINRSPNNANFSFKDTEGESLLMMLDNMGIACSTGSACSSQSLEPSHVILSLGLKHEDAHSSLRMTLGKYTTKEEITFAVKVLKETIKKLRGVSGDVLSDYYSKK
ncbi:MAG TPA: cysteine desulfurase family protein [Candidatus Pacearchaeota archaeon]|nr:cysteine desulfurase family protein [Candidatus Pacearchaeota archaeon]HPR80015.1 cysteine desulfurase family protein [Candidatus Pacearchaeota archaeon]